MKKNRALRRYYLTMCSVALVALGMTFLSGLLKGNVETLIFGLPATLVAFGVLNLLIARRIVRPIREFLVHGGSDGRSDEEVTKAVLALPRRSALVSALIGLSVVGIATSSAIILKGSSGARLLLEIYGIAYGLVVNVFVYTYFAVGDATCSIIRELAARKVRIAIERPLRMWKKILMAIVTISFLPSIHMLLLRVSGLSIVDFNETILTACVEGMFMATAITLLLARNISRPVGELVAASTRVKRGELDAETAVLSNDEIGILTERFNEMLGGLKERDFIKETFGKYISKEVAEEILQREVELGGEIRETTVLFADIRGFTTLSEEKAPQAVVSLLNHYFDVVVRVIHRHNGVVNKFMGDGIMAIFGAPLASSTHAEDAVAAAVEMQRGVQTLNDERNYGIRIGVGLHTGDVIVGNIGCSDRMEYTVIGDAVNLASRVEQATKTLSEPILLTADTFGRIDGRSSHVFRELDTITVKGRSTPILVYGV